MGAWDDRLEYAARLQVAFGDRALAVAERQAGAATGDALAAWRAICDLLAAAAPPLASSRAPTLRHGADG